MINQNRDRSRNARCIRRSRFQLLLLSSALQLPCCLSMLLATEAEAPKNALQSAPLNTTPVLKSVGIRFVNESKADTHSVKSATSFSGATHTESVPTLAPPRLAIKSESPTVTKESIPSKVILNTMATVPTIKMPPMVATSETKPATHVPNQTTSVKMEMASIAKPLGTTEILPNTKIASSISPIGANADAKETPRSPSPATSASNITSKESTLEAALEATVQTSPSFIALPREKTIASLNPEHESTSNADEQNSTTKIDKPDVGDLSMAPPPSLSTLAAPPTLEPPKTQLPAAAKAPLLAGKRSSDQNSRAPNIVRIPSMTLGNKSLESVEAAPSLVASKAASPELTLSTLKATSTPKPATLAPKASVADVVSPEIPPPLPNAATPAPKAAIANIASQPETALPVLKSLPATEEFAQKNETSDQEQFQGQPSSSTRIASNVLDQVAVIHQPVREAQPLEPTVVAFPASTKSSEWDRSVVSGLKPASLPPSQADQVAPSDSTTTSVELTYRDAQNLKLSGTIDRVTVSDESVCKAMLSDANGLVLLGVGQGKTQIKVWLAGDVHSEARVQQFDVTVREAWEARTPQGVTSYAEATQSLAELFPTAKIAIRASENGSLTIFGRADTDDQAKQIASLVRKMFLVPVQDRIATAPPK